MKRTVYSAAISRAAAATVVLAGVALSALPGSVMATRRASAMPLVVFTDGRSVLGQAELPAGASFDFTWTKNACANGYQDPAIAALATKHGNLLTQNPAKGQVSVERPWVLPCVKGPKTKPLTVRKAKPVIDIEIGPNGICLTINGRSFGCDIWGSLNSSFETHVWLFGGNTVAKGFVMKNGSRTTGGSVTVPQGTTHIDYYPRGSAIPYTSDPATTKPPATSPGPLYFRRYPVHNLGSSGQEFTATAKTVGQRTISDGDGADVMWKETACASASETPLKFVVAAARPDPSKNVFMLSDLYEVPCISSLASGGRTAINITVDLIISYNPFRITPTIQLGTVGGALLTDASVSAVSVSSYGGVFTNSSVCAPGSSVCEKTKPAPKPSTASWDLAVQKKA